MHEADRFGGEWTDIEIARFRKRGRKLLELGQSANEAEELAERLVYRDRDIGDDRRLCIECRSLNDEGLCRAYRALNTTRDFKPVRFILWRCDEFKLKGK
jgi:hypothetical protein